METSYHILVDKKYEFKLTPEEAEMLDEIDYPEISAAAIHKKSHILHHQKSFSVELLKEDFVNRNYTVKINGTIYDIGIQTPLDQLIAKMGLSIGNDSVEDFIYAPMPGVILEVSIEEGDTVKQGDSLCVLEAMKMENALASPRDGIIKTVNIVQGEAVDKGKLLIEFKEND